MVDVNIVSRTLYVSPKMRIDIGGGMMQCNKKQKKEEEKEEKVTSNRIHGITTQLLLAVWKLIRELD